MIIRKLEALFSFRFDPAQFDKANGEINRFAENANKAMAMLAGHFAIQTIKDFVDSTTQAMADVGRMANYLGISTQALEELRYAAQKSGVSLDAIDDALKEIQIRAVDAKSGTGEAAEAFQMLGIKSNDAAGRIKKPLELLEEAADAIKALPTHSQRIWVADAVFGDEGSTILRMLNDGSLGLKKMRQEARDLGYILDNESVESAKKFREAINALKAALSAIFRNITKSLLPVMTMLAERSTAIWTSFSKNFAKLNDHTSILRAAFIALCLVLSGLSLKAALAFAPFFAIGALLAGLALLIDDLWTAFRGGESVSKKVFAVITRWLQDVKAKFTGILGNIWDFLPGSLQENLKLAWNLLKTFAEKLAVVIWTVLRRSFGFILETIITVVTVLKDAIIKVFDFITAIFSKIGPILARPLVDAIDHAVSAIKYAIVGIQKLVSAAVPDFVKKGLSKAFEYVGDIGSRYEKPSERHLAPRPAYSSNTIQNQSHQNVHVSVNVKTGAEAHEIGSEVSKALRKELEKEKLNAFMGINRYAS